MDPLSATIPGSRHPITFPLAEQSGSSRSPPQTNGNSTLVLRRNSTTSTSSRRKPTRTYKSPAAHEALGLRIEGACSTFSTSPICISNSYKSLCRTHRSCTGLFSTCIRQDCLRIYRLVVQHSRLLPFEPPLFRHIIHWDCSHCPCPH